MIHAPFPGARGARDVAQRVLLSLRQYEVSQFALVMMRFARSSSFGRACVLQACRSASSFAADARMAAARISGQVSSN